MPNSADRELELRRGAFRATVRADLGGSLSGFWCDRDDRTVAILRPAPPDADDPLQMASFPLIPFCNRIAHGEFEWEGRRVRLAPTHPCDPLPLHGHGWRAPWRVVRREAAAVELHWAHAAGEWPWAYEAWQRYALEPGALVIELSLVNRDREPMPAGLGHHPYFPRAARTRLRAQLPWRWEVDDALIPRLRVANPDAAAFARGLPLDRLRVDHAYTGWDALAAIDQPDDGLAISLEATAGDAFHLYCPQAPLFCAEAVQNQPNALNDPRAEAPMRRVAPGATLAYRLRIAVASVR